MINYLKRSFLLPLIIFILYGNTYAFDISDIPQIGVAFLTNLAIHESGHYAIAEAANVKKNNISFLTSRNGDFFFGLSSVTSIDEKSKFVYKLGGEIASSYTFEFALANYRSYPTVYNQSLLFFSGTDFLWYSLYSFYLSPHENRFYDPVGIAEETGLSKSTIVSIAFLQTFLNSMRVYYGSDDIVPYFSFDRYSASFNVKFSF